MPFFGGMWERSIINNIYFFLNAGLSIGHKPSSPQIYVLKIQNLASCIIILALGIRTGMGPSHPTIVTWVQIPVLMPFNVS